MKSKKVKIFIPKDLKPCPFCNETPSFYYDNFHNGYIIECNNKNCKINLMYVGPCTTKQEARQLWNTRKGEKNAN